MTPMAASMEAPAHAGVATPKEPVRWFRRVKCFSTDLGPLFERNGPAFPAQNMYRNGIDDPDGRFHSRAYLEEVPAPVDAPDMVTLPEHYSRFKIEPIRFAAENRLDFFQSNIVKYVCRHDAKNGLEDLRKARRYLDMYIAFKAGDPDWWTASSSPSPQPQESAK